MPKKQAMPALTGFQAEEAKPVAPGVDWVEEMVGALTDPIIVFPAGGWEQDLPERLKKELPLHRLAHLMRCSKGEAEWDEACDLEALLYIYPASLAAPMGEQWSRIYLYLGTKVMGQKFPDDIRQNELSQYDMGELRGLKRWIRKKVLEARKVRRRQGKAQEQKEPQVQAEECEQMKLGL